MVNNTWCNGRLYLFDIIFTDLFSQILPEKILEFLSYANFDFCICLFAWFCVYVTCIIATLVLAMKRALDADGNKNNYYNYIICTKLEIILKWKNSRKSLTHNFSKLLFIYFKITIFAVDSSFLILELFRTQLNF